MNYEGAFINISPRGLRESEFLALLRPGVGYHLTKLLCFILEHIPAKKRLVATMNANREPEMWQDNDSREYSQKCQRLTAEGVTAWMAAGAGLGAAIGSLVPGIGTVVGTAVGTVLGGAVAFVSSLFSW